MYVVVVSGVSTETDTDGWMDCWREQECKSGMEEFGCSPGLNHMRCQLGGSPRHGDGRSGWARGGGGEGEEAPHPPARFEQQRLQRQRGHTTYTLRGNKRESAPAAVDWS